MKPLREVLIEIINGHQGVKGVDLLVEIPPEYYVDQDTDQILAVIDELERSDDIVILEYTVPQVPGRLKTMYFPKGTVIG